MRTVLFFIVLLPLPLMNQDQILNHNTKREKVIELAEQFLGKPYKMSHGVHRFDCSGYVRYLMSKIDVVVTRSSISQVHDGIKVNDVSQAQPGDILVFRGRSKNNSRPGHVGLVHHWSNDTLYFIHSSVQKGITIDHMYEPYYKSRFLQVRNVID
ncbi:MAG: C40 family peptidase [Saprospiraceae bacterium]